MNLNSRSLKSSLVSCVKRGRCNESHVRVLLPTIPEIEPSESGIASTFTASLPEKLDIDCRRETAIELAIELVKAKIEDIRIRRRTQDYIYKSMCVSLTAATEKLERIRSITGMRSILYLEQERLVLAFVFKKNREEAPLCSLDLEYKELNAQLVTLMKHKA